LTQPSAELSAAKRRFGIGLAILALALAWFFAKGLGFTDNSTPIDMRLSRDGRWVVSKPFRPFPAGSYRASLEMNGKYRRKDMMCLADVAMPVSPSGEGDRPTDCPPQFSRVEIEWTIEQNGEPLPLQYDFGRHAGEYSGDVVGRSLGGFDLNSREAYVFRARVVRAPAATWATTPRVKLSYDDGAGLAVRALFVWGASFVMGLVGLAIAVRELPRLLRRGMSDEGTR
jgi:hypothetical protein